MIRVKDPKKSGMHSKGLLLAAPLARLTNCFNLLPCPVEFYERLGLSQINKLDFEDAKFSLYFLAYTGIDSLSGDRHWTDRNGVLELTHNWGSENDPNFKVANGNEEPHRGFGHIAISVDNIQVACKVLERAGAQFQKKLDEGKMRNIAFVKDPDGYWVELIQKTDDKTMVSAIAETNIKSYRLNHTMLRVKDPDASLDFYRDIMGMQLLREVKKDEAGFNLYFLGYPNSNPPPDERSSNPYGDWEGLLELTWNYGTEKKEGKVYHDGNSDPQGFGHICKDLFPSASYRDHDFDPINQSNIPL